MKQKDILLIGTVVIISAAVSIVLSGKLITSPKNRQTKVEVVLPFSDQFPTADAKYFNDKSIDPTQNIKIGGNNNPQPFNGNGQ